MLSISDTVLLENLDDYCNRAVNTNEAVVITRELDKNVVILSLEEYEKMLKIIKNAEYIDMVKKSISQLEAGMGGKYDLIEDVQ